VFLGLDGIVIKSHGGTDEKGLLAVDIAYEMVPLRPARQDSREIGSPRSHRGRDHARTGEETRVTTRVYCAASAAICRRASSPMPNSPRPSTRPTSGSAAHRHPQRHIAAEGENTSDLAARRPPGALECRVTPDDIDLIVVATTTPGL
jgi:hypothetical protein